VADYDADYLYNFQKSDTQKIPLGSFYKLATARGYWHLHHLDAQQRKRQLLVVAQNTGWFGRSGNSGIHGFIDAVWQHNPNLDVCHDWFK
jgi:hypothetical protein